MLTEALATHAPLGLWPSRRAEYTPGTRTRAELAEPFTPDEVAGRREELARLRAHMDAVFAEYDLVRSPVAATGPPRFDDRVDPRDLAAAHVVLQDLLGLPALALPDGTQLTGARGTDAQVLAAARESLCGMRLALALVLLAVVAAPAQAKTRWLCSAAMAQDPCDRPGDTVALRTDGTAKRVPSRRTHRSVDCFYVYPTVSEQRRTNATPAEPEVRSIATYQASRFASQCRIFAPLYRQVTLQGIFGGGLAGDARELAYGDVRTAWRTYLRRFNHGRGVVLIGHSQGTGMLRKLVSDEIDDRPAVRRRLVSALLLGGNVLVKRGSDRGGDFDHVRCACAGSRPAASSPTRPSSTTRPPTPSSAAPPAPTRSPASPSPAISRPRA